MDNAIGTRRFEPRFVRRLNNTKENVYSFPSPKPTESNFIMYKLWRLFIMYSVSCQAHFSEFLTSAVFRKIKVPILQYWSSMQELGGKQHRLKLTTALHFHFPSPSMIVMYRSKGRSVILSVNPLGWGHFTSSQSIFLRCPIPSTIR